MALALSIAVAGLTLSAAAFAQTTTDPVSPYTNTTPTPPPTSEELPQTDTGTNPPPTPTQDERPDVTSNRVPPPPRANPTASGAPAATTAAQPNTPPQRLAFTGYDPLIVGFAGVVLMLGAFALSRRRGTE